MSLLLDDEIALENDSQYKIFSETIGKILRHFESSTEWADLLANLVKLKKTIDSYSQFQSIPKCITLTKRLAQCLHPALPSGIHLKTIEIYETIFQKIDKRHLQRNIILYSYGLFPLLPDAALCVKPVLLSLYENYFLPLSDGLNPILTGFLIGLFSTLEIGADYYTRIIKLLDNLTNNIDEFYFYTCIWSSINLVSSVRYSAITFIINHFDKRKNMKEQIYLIGSSIDTMVSAICTCLHDNEQSLVQRSILDFLLICLPMNEYQLEKIHIMKIISGVLHILLKRDMSLNRRIYTWFLGTNESSRDINDQQHQMNELNDLSSYFIRHTQGILIESLRKLLEKIYRNAVITNIKSNENDDNKSTTNNINVLPSTWTLPKLIRVLLVLVDKEDVGPNMIESIFMNYLLIVYEQIYHSTKSLTSTNIQHDNNQSDTLKTFNMLLDTLEPYFIWEFLTENFDIVLNEQEDKKTTTAGCTVEEICGIINMLLDIFSLESSTDFQSEHLSKMLYHLIEIMNNNIEKLTPNQITLCIEMLLKILKNIFPTDTNHNLSIFQRSIKHQRHIFDNNLTDNDTEDENEQTSFIDNEYSTDIYNKLFRTDSIDKLPNSNIIIEKQYSNDIERLLRQMVRKVDKQIQKLNNSYLNERRTRLSTKTISESMIYIEKSIKLYKIFFHRFISIYFIDKNQLLMNEKFQSIYSIIQNKTNKNLLTIFNQYQQLNELQLKLNENVEHYKTSFEHCCKLLIEFCYYPRQSNINDQPVLSTGKTDFDDWSIDLCILSICKNEHFSLQTIATSVLIELFGSALNFYNKKNIEKPIDNIENNLSIFPSFTQEQINLLLNETDFFQYIIAYFWEYLNDKYDRDYNLKASHILLILHSILPNNLCEDLICYQLSLINTQQSNNDIQIIEEYKKFFKFWSLIPNVLDITDKHVKKSFQHCVIYILNVLKETNNHYFKLLIQQWISNCFIHGYIYRIFDILLIKLLQLDTLRISFQRFDPIIHNELFHDEENTSISINSNNTTDDIDEIQLSVTFDDGSNEYHNDEYSYDNETEQEDTNERKRTRTNSYTNQNESIDDVKSSPQIIKFHSLLQLSQPILSGIRSLSPPVLIKTVKQRAPSLPVIFGRSRNLSDSNTNISQTYTSGINTNSMSIGNIINESNSLQINDLIDIQNAYILFYTQSYDYNRIILSLNIIENLIDFIPQQLIHTLLITSNVQLSSFNIDNHHMHELFLKHCRSIEGKDFNFFNENNHEYQSYLYLLLNILLIYICSYYPKCFNNEENIQIHIHSLILLKRICHNLSYICTDNRMMIYYIINLFKKVSFQKIILCLFNRIFNKKSKIKIIHDYNNDLLYDQLIKEFIELLEEIILLENIIYSTDFSIINQLIVHQTIFLSTIIQYLKQIKSIENHHYIINLVRRILPYCSSALKTISTRIIEQLCRNLCFIFQYYNQQETKIKFKQLSSFNTIDYIIYLIQNLSYICNYCLINTVNPTQHFNQTLCPQYWMTRIRTTSNDLSDARQSIINKYPLIISNMIYIWKIILINQTNSIWSVYHIKQIQEKILEFISSLIKSDGVSFVRAIIKYWGQRKRQQKLSNYNNIDEIKALINILMNINNYTINDMIYNMNEFIRNQSIIVDKKKQNYIVWCLQFLLIYLEQQKNISIDYCSILSIMFKECFIHSTSPSVSFLIIKILSFYVKQSSLYAVKRDLQDITMKVLENCNSIIASSLEQTNWLRKNLQVRIGQSESESILTINNSSYEIDRSFDSDSNTIDFDDNSQSVNYSLISLKILSEHAAQLLDMVYNLNDEKDRVIIPYLQNLIINIMPYIRTNISSNTLSYRLALTLLMNISQYSYTKKTWKKEIFEQLFDINFFQIDISILRLWKIIVDNMIIADKSTFRDFMNKLNTSHTRIFVPKEQHEQRAMLIKRFAFIIYASEKDNYNEYLPEILQHITDLLKSSHVPIIYTQIFLFLRVLLIRVSRKNLALFWPIIMSELIQVLLQLEQELVSDIEGDTKSYVQRMTINEINTTNISNTSYSLNPSLKMYLYACKLLDILLAMPYSEVEHFIYVRSAFVADQGIINQNLNPDIFMTYSIRLSKLLEQKLQSISTSLHDHLSIIKTSNYPLLRLRMISNIFELFPFFNYLGRKNNSDNLYSNDEQILLSDKINDIETSVLEDFIES